MAEDDPIFQGDFVKLSESRRLFIGSKSDSWKPKHIILRRKGDKPVLEYHKKKQKNPKKGERTLTNSFDLWPTFKVEKLTHARGRAFVCEITAPDIHQFLSSDKESDIDIFVFLLQSQIQLKENLREDIVSVTPDESDSQIKIGAKGSPCFLHISPWGITLALAKSRALLAQWPLKSIRYYETSGSGHFTIEAGRVAPMGEGVFGFRTAMGEDDKTYDLVDNYIVNTLDRVKPSQRGTQEEIEDYIREHDFLHSLTMVRVRPKSDQEVKHVLKQCWNIGNGADSQQDQGRNDSTDAQPSSTQPPSTASNTQTSSLSVTLERTGGQGSSNTFPSDAKSSKRPSLSDVKTSPTDGRPPLPGRVAKRSRRRDHSLPRKIDVARSSSPQSDDTSSQTSAQQRMSGASVVVSGPRTPELPNKRGNSSSSLLSQNSVQPRRHSNPSSVVHQVNPNAVPPPNQSLAVHSYQNQQDHPRTEFYNLNSPNLKVRVSKSPNVTRHPNKVGRAEYLLTVSESGVRSPSSPERTSKNFRKWDLSPSQCSSEEENQEAKRYLDAVTRASQKKYGGHNSLDRNWPASKQGENVEKDRQSLQLESVSRDSKASLSPAGYVNAPNGTGGYINLNDSNNSNNQGKEKCSLQDRQSSVESFTSALSRQNSLKNPSSPPPAVHHHRQRSAPVESDWSPSGHQDSPQLRKKGVPPSNTSHEDSGVSLRSRNSQLSSDDGLSRDSTHSIGSFKSAASRQTSGYSTLDHTDSPVTNWLMSASCEDLSDHMRHVIFHDGDEDGGVKGGEEYESTYEEIRNTEDSGGGDPSINVSTTSDDKPPLPFTGLKKFQNNGCNRDRSKSFGYMNIPQGTKDDPGLPVKQPSTAPSAHLIRKMVSARAKQETLRKSLSNPNFLNLGSKEQLFKLKINSRSIGSSSGNLSTNGEKLGSGTKSKSRSFGSLFPAIKRALSRESIGGQRDSNGVQSRSTTPERRSSLRNSFSLRRRSSERDIGLHRQNSLHTHGEMTIKGIRMTTRSRSFRRVRGTKSVEGLSSMLDSDTTGVDDSNANPSASSATNSEIPGKQLRTSASSASIKAMPDQDNPGRSSRSSAQLRLSSSSSNLKTASNRVDLRKSAPDSTATQPRASSTSTGDSRISKKSTDVRKKSDSVNPSYSANINITLSSPQNVESVSTTSISSHRSSNPTAVSLSSHPSNNTTSSVNHFGNSSTIPQSSTMSDLELPPPPIPPRQKTVVASNSKPTASASSNSSVLKISGQNKNKHFNTANTTTSSNYMNAQFPPSSVKSSISSHSSINANVKKSSNVNVNNNDIKPQVRADIKVANSTFKDSFPRKDNPQVSNSKENPASAVQSNGERSRPTRRKSGMDNIR